MQTGVAQPDAQFEITFGGNVPQEARDAIELGINTYSEFINAHNPIKVHVIWQAPPNGSLGGCIPTSTATMNAFDLLSAVSVWGNPNPFEFINSWANIFGVFGAPKIITPGALFKANFNSGSPELNNLVNDLSSADILMMLNPSGGANGDWDFSLNPPADENTLDAWLVGTVQHELLHGLGLVTNYIFTNPIGPGTITMSSVSLYDTHLLIGNGSNPEYLIERNNLITSTFDSSNDINAAILDQNTGIFWEGENAQQHNEGQRPRIYTVGNPIPVPMPDTPDCTQAGLIDYTPGSSLTHVDLFSRQTACGTESVWPLFFYRGVRQRLIVDGVVIDSLRLCGQDRFLGPDPVVLGMLEDLGYSIDYPTVGCANPMACNYDFTVANELNDPFDFDDCTYGDDYWIPSNLPLPENLFVRCADCPTTPTTGAPPGHVRGEPTCVQSILEANNANQGGSTPSFEWTSQMQADYESCLQGACKDQFACYFDLSPSTYERPDRCVNCEFPESCVNIELEDAGGDGWGSVEYAISIAGGGPIIFEGSLEFGSRKVDSFCLNDGCYEFTVANSAGTGILKPDEISWTVSGQNIEAFGSTPSIKLGTFTFSIGDLSSNCSLPSACNYNPCYEASGTYLDNGIFVPNGQVYDQLNCIFPSCCNQFACNYDPDVANSGQTQCCDDNLCIFLAPGATPLTDDTHPEYLTNIPWSVGISTDGLNFAPYGTLYLDSLQGVVFTDLPPGYPNSVDGTWSCCGSEVVFYASSNDNEWRCDFSNFDPLIDSLIVGDLFLEDGTTQYSFTLEPQGFTVGCLDNEACNYESMFDVNDANACIYPLCNDSTACNYIDNQCVLEPCNYFMPNTGFNDAVYKCDVDMNCNGINEQGFLLTISLSNDSNNLEVVQYDVEGSLPWTNSWVTLCGNELRAFGMYENESMAIVQCSLNGDGFLATEASIKLANIEGCATMSRYVLGCMDADACNYDAEATYDSGTCVYPGCLDVEACNYNSNAGCSDNGTCTYVNNGATLLAYDWILEVDWDGVITSPNSQIVTFNESFNVSIQGDALGQAFDGNVQSCWPDINIEGTGQYGLSYVDHILTGTFDLSEDAFVGDIYNSWDWQGTFLLRRAIPGCLDPTSCNFNQEANISDESCSYEAPAENPATGDWGYRPTLQTTGLSYPINFQSTDSSKTWTISLLGIEGWYAICAETLSLYSYGTLMFQGTWDDESNSFVGEDSNAAIVRNTVGCTDSSACNYEAEATVDDGSCDYSCLGCTDPTACNFLPEATVDDGTCLYLSYPYCDCGSDEVFDAVGVCGGDCQNDLDEDGICDDIDGCVGTIDACGVCNGPGAIYECGCTEIPQGECDCDGNIAQPYCSDPAACNFFPIEDGCVFDDPSFCQYNDVDLDGICDNVDDCVSEYNCMGCGSCQIGFNINDTLSGGEYSPNMYALASGEVTEVEISLLYNPLTSNSWPGDMLVQIQKPSGECIEFGGFDFSTCPNLIGNYQEVYPSIWAATSPTELFEANAQFDNLEFIDGEGFWSVRVANGWTGSSEVHYNVLIKVNGLCPVNQSPESISNILCGPGTMFDFVTHQCLPINNCQSDFDGDGNVTTSDLLLFLSDFGLSCP